MSSSESEDMVISHEIYDMIDDVSDIPPVVPEKSRYKYEACYSHFTDWLKNKHFSSIDEKVMLAYFLHKSAVQKPPSLWAEYSKLRTTIFVNNNVNISKFRNLLGFLKRKSVGYVPKRTKVFTRNDINKFLLEARDEDFLLMKVVLIIGVAGACGRQELAKLSTKDITDLGEIMKVTKAPNEFTIADGCLGNASLLHIIRKYESLRSNRTAHDRFFVICRGLKCTTQPVGSHQISSMSKKIATFLHLKDPECYTSNCFRRSSGTCYTVPNLNSVWKSASVANGYIQNNTNISDTVIKQETYEPNEYSTNKYLDPLHSSSFCTKEEYSVPIQSQCGSQTVADQHYNHISPTYDEDETFSSMRLPQDEISDSLGLAAEEIKHFNLKVLKKIDVVVEQQQRQNDQLEKMNSNFDRMNSNCEKMNTNFEKMNNNFETLIAILKGKFASD